MHMIFKNSIAIETSERVSKTFTVKHSNFNNDCCSHMVWNKIVKFDTMICTWKKRTVIVTMHIRGVFKKFWARSKSYSLILLLNIGAYFISIYCHCLIKSHWCRLYVQFRKGNQPHPFSNANVIDRISRLSTK